MKVKFNFENQEITTITSDMVKQAIFDGCTFKNIKFSNRIKHCHFLNCTFTASNFSYADIKNCYFENCTLTDCIFALGKFTTCFLKNCDFKNVKFDSIIFNCSTVFDVCKLSSCIFTNCSYNFIRLEQSEFTDCNFFPGYNGIEDHGSIFTNCLGDIFRCKLELLKF